MKTPVNFLLALALVAFAGISMGCVAPDSNPSNTEKTIFKTVGENQSAEANAADPALSEASFSEDSYSFGEVKFEVPAKHTFRFTNTGTEPLKIEKVKPSCGCTATNYSKEPIAPGAEGFVELTYNAKKMGIFRKTATVTMNTQPQNKILSISGEVVK